MSTILTERESRLAVVLFEMLKPQIEKMIDEKLDGFKESEINDSSSFDIGEYTSEINDIIEDYVRYNITITSTID
tara:strand:- start:3468 stop:3692 length:225 start_codon:yes stop_codon:yes gene_type:complete